jgi:hypothetical protein
MSAGWRGSVLTAAVLLAAGASACQGEVAGGGGMPGRASAGSTGTAFGTEASGSGGYGSSTYVGPVGSSRSAGSSYTAGSVPPGRSATSQVTSATYTTSTTTSTSNVSGACNLPTSVPSLVLYSGGIPAPACPRTIAIAGNYWFAYYDSLANPSGTVTFTYAGELGGCDGQNDCAFHAVGSNILGYGGGVGFTLNNNAAFDASSFVGLRVWFKGVAHGTHGVALQAMDNVVHVKLVTTQPDGGDPRSGDDYGAFCAMAPTSWGLCQILFSGATREGVKAAPDPATDTFDPQNLKAIQFEFSSLALVDSGSAPPVSFDVWIDDVAFY